ncbi:HzsA-related protein [Pontiella sulfatireligans]|uniref:Hydrazine synthase alpha subunit middle domain-containing protein n=1 Tax=Pontiella sulfatireligans TaxID=2750658 RepID=A0A6C2UHN2_9BACT|nr:hypothetical protein [Pontiella sulfatireligans]VGO19722.1 hypothetical protein SCARR_01781 [Pontiella sulfatireligans]
MKKLIILLWVSGIALGAGAAKKNAVPMPVMKADRMAVRAAIEDLMATYGDDYPNGRNYLKKLEGADDAQLEKVQREALAANPLISGQPILFVVRRQYKSDHHNTATLFQAGEINAHKYDPPGVLKMLDISNDWNVSTVFDPGPTGIARDPELSFDGGKIIFSMRKSIDDDYHIYEINIDGTGLRQLTFATGISDIDPFYLVDGSIAFSATREPKFCMCNRHIMANLFRMDADGANIHQIGKSTLFEGHGSLMPDGRILYDRWEYVDRNYGDAQGLWTVNPDGSNHAVFWGNNTASPGGVIDARIIPGTQLCLAIFGSCHDRPWGALAIIDRSKGVDGREPVVRTWPASAVELVKERIDKGYGFDHFKQVRPRYEDPYPLSEKYFLVSCMVGAGEQMGIYLVDTFGNEVLLHTEAPGCYDPMPIAPRTRPNMKPSLLDFSKDTGHFYVQNVYIGTHMEGVERGSIKYLRIVESPEKRNWTHGKWGGQGTQAPGMNWTNFESKRILGTVPVEADGSAYFEVPSDRFVFFQALDKDGMMVQSMRSGTIIMPGEVQGCIGCHENRVEDAPPVSGHNVLALKRPPSKLNGWFGEQRMFSYMSEVQPIFDKHCLKCHDFGKKGAQKLVLAGDRAVSFNASYIDLWAKGAITCVGAGPADTQPAYSWGSHPSKLIKVLREGHHKVTLSLEEMLRIVTWLDINAPYYPVYECAYPDNPCGRSPITAAQVKRVEELTGTKIVLNHRTAGGAQISFDRPVKSPCLTNLEKGSPEYNEALAIIEAGQAQLQKLPRADMDGFMPNPTDLKRIEKYQQRQKAEAKNRAVIRDGKKVYDQGFSASQ